MKINILLTIGCLLVSCSAKTESEKDKPAEQEQTPKHAYIPKPVPETTSYVPVKEDYYGIWYPLTIDRLTNDTLANAVDYEFEWTKEKIIENLVMEDYPALVTKVEYADGKFKIRSKGEYDDGEFIPVYFTPQDKNTGIWERIAEKEEPRLCTRTPQNYKRAKSYGELWEEQMAEEELPFWRGEYTLLLPENEAVVKLFIEGEAFRFEITENGKKKTYPVKFSFFNETEIQLATDDFRVLISYYHGDRTFTLDVMKDGNAGFLGKYLESDKAEMEKKVLVEP